MNADPVSILSGVGREVPSILLGTSVVAMNILGDKEAASEALGPFGGEL